MKLNNLPVLLEFDDFDKLVEYLGDSSISDAKYGHANNVKIGNKYVYKIRKTVGGKVSSKFRKEAAVLNFLELHHGNSTLSPRLVLEARVTDCYILVQERLIGEHRHKFDSSSIHDLVAVLKDLHSTNYEPVIFEFEGDEPISLEEYFSTKTPNFIKTIWPKVSDEDRKLLEDSASYIKESMLIVKVPEKFSLIHKDLSFDNLLFSEKRSVKIIDWEAAQLAPKEWEFAIIRQRLPDLWQVLEKEYRGEFDQDLINVCGIVQSLRFWKSFMFDSLFVEQQRDYIKSILRKR